MSDNEYWAPEGNKNYETLYTAVIEENSQKLKAALESDVNVNALYGHPPHQGWTALHAAASRGNIDAMRILLAHGARVDAKAPDRHPEGNGDEPPLFYAARAALPEAARILLDAGADPTIKSNGYSSHSALNLVLVRCILDRARDPTVKAGQSHIDTINLLLDAGLDINHVPSPYWDGTLIQQAVDLDDINLVKLLIYRGADAGGSLDRIQASLPTSAETVALLLGSGAGGKNGEALVTLAAAGNLEAISLLAQHTDASTAPRRVDALNFAASRGHEDVVREILSWGVDVNGLDRDGATALLSACQAETPLPSVIRLLLEAGADTSLPTAEALKPTKRSYFQKSPLHALIRSCDPEAVQALLEAGANVELRNASGETPLITLASAMATPLPRQRSLSARQDVFQILLDAGSDVNATDTRGRTALHEIAAITGDSEVEARLACGKLLVLRGVDVGKLDSDRRAAADLLTANSVEFVQLLNPRRAVSVF